MPTMSSSSASRAAGATKQATQETCIASSGTFKHPIVSTALPFVNGGIAGMAATAMIQPVDMIKVRLQLAGEGRSTGPKPTAMSITKNILASGRVLDLYTGLSAGLLRQAVYTTARLGFFDTFMDKARSLSSTRQQALGFKERAVAGLSAGGLAAMIGNPADLALIRMQSDGLKPVAERVNYRSVLDALMRISRSEGITALWSGSLPTIARAMALNFGQLAFFSEAKSQLKANAPSMNPTAQTLVASGIAGFFASFFSLPFDFVKTRLQKQERRKDGTLPYRGMSHCVSEVVKKEGLLRFYRGFATYYIRIAPHA
jgi:solute carrier family 25 oxoglutarate transporter 11